MYPSEQQYYNAMVRKGYASRVRPEEVPAILRIHNAVNERGWAEVKRWERGMLGGGEKREGEGEGGGVTTRLTRFVGRPTDLSPKAFLKTYLLGYTRPFDRHDWFVATTNKSETTERRYVIDFYSGAKSGSGSSGGDSLRGGGSTVDVYLDVRPAIDDFDTALKRAKMFVEDFTQSAK